MWKREGREAGLAEGRAEGLSAGLTKGQTKTQISIIRFQFFTKRKTPYIHLLERPWRSNTKRASPSRLTLH